ncbi:MAG: DUF2403 domain-containing lipoprotein [Polyangiaceae bacterium]|nr:DUF2403 domain-containing lipoprotein [Myxococcales bacterium]MCB9586210.1 DUF2403 domain-containing lipoprotein [Polyangiaceae bacterium]MCB9606887.1 DUF2403 domain-containing lipoprotein [Polyangiaceae bacterium]
MGSLTSTISAPWYSFLLLGASALTASACQSDGKSSAGSGGNGAVSAGGSAQGGSSSGAAGAGNAASAGSTNGGSASGGTTGGAGNGGSGNGGSGNQPPTLGGGLGEYPTETSDLTLGGSMTFTNVGAPGWWPRRIDRAPGDAACNYKDGTDTWGGHCCMKEQHSQSNALAPFDEEMTLILKAIDIKQVAVYQPQAASTAWGLVSAWDRRTGEGQNLAFTQDQAPMTQISGELIHDDCVWYLAQNQAFDCGDGRDYFCPDDPGVKRLGWRGSKLFVLLASMTFDDAGVSACNGTGQGHPGPWVALVASELIRDGARKWNGACNCYSKTGSVGDGCGEINLFEVVMDNNQYSNREFISTGVRSYQAGHVGGNVCGSGCARDDFPADATVVDACGKQAYGRGPEIAVGGAADGCPVWKRPIGDRYFLVLLDESQRSIQLAIVHPDNIPSQAAALLPSLPADLPRAAIDALLALRLPSN